MKYNQFNRRMFLQGLGGVLLPIPFLSSLLPREAWAQTSSAPKRFITIGHSYDYGHHSSWFPHSGPINDVKQPVNVMNLTDGQKAFRYQSLRDFAPSSSSMLSTIFGSQLSPYLEYINMMRSLDLIDCKGHHGTKILGGIIDKQLTEVVKKIPTIDYVINSNKSFNPAGLPLAVIGGLRFGKLSLSENADGTVSPSTSIGIRGEDVYNFLFGGGSVPEGNEGTVEHPRFSQLDAVLEDYKRISNHRKISSTEKARLNDTMDLFSDIQKGLKKEAVASCKHKQIPSDHSEYLRVREYTNSGAGKLLADIVTATMTCDVARVFSIGAPARSGDVGGGYIWGGHASNEKGYYGTHDAFNVLNGKANWEVTAMAQSFLPRTFLAPLLKNLSSINDPGNGKSLLYNSLVFYTMESSTTHSSDSQPCILAGNAGGALTSGYYLDYADRSIGGPKGDPTSPTFLGNYRGVHYNRLLVTILQAMGLSPSDYERPLGQYTYGRSDIGDQNKGISNVGGWGYVWGDDYNSKGYLNSAKNTQHINLADYKKPLPLPKTNG